ncbi:MAG: protein-glutamate O-methyltransferase CheR, partial [Chloroflexi bacterium]|nr:protein-glutamate O-methyltransferase CheR [Chloroflexota bacterium]
NVLIYFNKRLQARVHELFLSSLVRRGFLALGSKEALQYSAHEEFYDQFEPKERIYRRIK